MKADPLWTAVDQFITDSLIAPDAALDGALADSTAAGLPPINVTPSQGRFLQIIAQSMTARRILEVGTLGGYSTIWLARALPPGGLLITLEIDPRTAAVARANLKRAGLDKIVDVRIGPALATMKTLAAEAREPFDLVFIDADKQNNPEYFARALDLTHSGSLIIIDNAVREGTIIEADNRSPDVQGTRRVYQAMAAEKRVSATAIQTVGSKGYDGFAIARVL